MALDPKPVTLSGTHVRLEPLTPGHAESLLEAGRDESIWTWLTRGPFLSVDDAHGWIERALTAARDGTQVPFVIVNARTQAVVGSTRYMDIRTHDRGLEIGWTWLGVAAQRTPINTECKYLLLSHAFEILKFERVQLKTDLRNLRSQAAIERIGATREGVLRTHVLTRDGYMRDSVLFSVIAPEWPAVKLRLEGMMRGHGRER